FGVAGDFLGGRLRARALHGEQDDVSLAQGLRLGLEPDAVGLEADRKALIVADREAVFGDFLPDPRSPQEGDVQPRREPGAADIAADRAGAVDDDLRTLGQGSAPSPIGGDALVRDPEAGRRRAGLPEDVDRNAAARIPVAADAQPSGLHLLRQPLADADGDILVEAAMIAEPPQEQLPRLGFD